MVLLILELPDTVHFDMQRLTQNSRQSRPGESASVLLKIKIKIGRPILFEFSRTRPAWPGRKTQNHKGQFSAATGERRARSGKKARALAAEVPEGGRRPGGQACAQAAAEA